MKFMKKNNLYIVIAVFNRKEITIRCIEQLKEQANQDFKIVLVDDNSTDGTKDAISEKFPEIDIVEGTGDWWWTRSMNEGMKHAVNKGASHILIMNNDTIFDKDYIEKVVAHITEYPDAIIGTLDITKEEPHKIFFSGVKKMIWWKAKGITYHKNYDLYEKSMSGIKKSVALNGRGTIIPTEVFSKIGFLDERNLPQYASDFDFTLRAARNKIETLISWDLVVYSYVGETGAGKPYIKQPFGTFAKSFFNKYSQTSISTWYKYYRNHCYPIVFVFPFLLQLLKLIFSYFKRQKSFA